MMCLCHHANDLLLSTDNSKEIQLNSLETQLEGEVFRINNFEVKAFPIRISFFQLMMMKKAWRFPWRHCFFMLLYSRLALENTF